MPQGPPAADVGPALVAALRARTDAMVADLEALVAVESPSSDPLATRDCLGVASALGRRLLGADGEVVEVDGRAHLRWRLGHGLPRVLLLAHADTVWPRGTLARWPFAVRDDGTATGPGTFDMKAGLVQGLHALACLDELDGVELLVTTDEELGSATSRGLIEDAARGLDAVLVLEPSAPGGLLKSARKGVSTYELVVTGRAAHAGLEPERGVNALVELAHQVLAVGAIAAPGAGTTVTPTVAVAGTTMNVVPAAARATVDVRVATPGEQERVDRAIRGLRPVMPQARLDVLGGPNRPPLPRSASTALLARAEALCAALGLPWPGHVAVGGGSDGNLTAGVGTPTLDGLGPVGDGAHAEGEHVVVAAMPERAALVAALVADVLARGPEPSGIRPAR